MLNGTTTEVKEELAQKKAKEAVEAAFGAEMGSSEESTPIDGAGEHISTPHDEL